MKTLYLMRHAKSSWEHAGRPDHDRPLTRRGRKAARTMARFLAAQNTTIDLIISSTARRAKKTAKRMARAAKPRIKVIRSDNLYHASPAQWILSLKQLPDSANSVLAVGHNPALEELIHQLTGTSVPMPTASIAHLTLPIDSWSALELRMPAALHDIWRPKELTTSAPHIFRDSA